MNQQGGGSGKKIALIVIAVVLGLCCLSGVGGGAVSYSVWTDYLLRSKMSEASANLRNLFVLSASYYDSENWGSRDIVVVGGNSVAESACTVDPARASNTPGPGKSVLDWSSESQSFQQLGFFISDPIYYQYEIAGPPGRCGNVPNTRLYSFRAHGDLDGDGDQSLFEITARSNELNELERSPGVRRFNEEE